MFPIDFPLTNIDYLQTNYDFLCRSPNPTRRNHVGRNRQWEQDGDDSPLTGANLDRGYRSFMPHLTGGIENAFDETSSVEDEMGEALDFDVDNEDEDNDVDMPNIENRDVKAMGLAAGGKLSASLI